MRIIYRVNKLEKWNREHPYSKRFDELNKIPNATYTTFEKAIEHENSEIVANFLWCLAKVTIYLLGQQIKHLEHAFINERGLRERE